MRHLRRVLRHPVVYLVAALGVSACGILDVANRSPRSASMNVNAYVQAEVGQQAKFLVPGGTPQSAYVTTVGTQTLSNLASAWPEKTGTLVVYCKDDGEGWIHMHTGNGYWKIYHLTCVDDGGYSGPIIEAARGLPLR